MTTYLVDANVLSEATKADPDPNAMSWLAEHETDIVVNPVIVGELRYGIDVLPRGRRRSRLMAWFDGGVGRLDCVELDAATGIRWAQLLVELRAAGTPMPVKDSLIAATALQHGLTVATHNRADFRRSRVLLVDPFEP